MNNDFANGRPQMLAELLPLRPAGQPAKSVELTELGGRVGPPFVGRLCAPLDVTEFSHSRRSKWTGKTYRVRGPDEPANNKNVYFA